MNSIVHHTHPMLTRFDLAESRFRWMAPLTILVVFCSACHALGQAIPKVAGEIEDVWVSDRVSWLEGPSFGAGDVWFADPGNIWKGGDPTRLMRFDPDTGETNVAIDFDVDPDIYGTAFDTAGRLIATHLGLGTVTRRTVAQSDRPDVLVDGLNGNVNFVPNDLVVDSSGGIYFTSFTLNESPNFGDSAVYYINPAGELTKALDLTGSRDANGIGISPDGNTVYVAMAFQGIVNAYDVVDSGVLQNERFFAASPGGLDGMTVDRQGNVYVSDLGLTLPPNPQQDLPGSVIRVFDPDGKDVLTIDPPHGVINMTFSPDDDLYISGWNTLSRVPIEFESDTVSQFRIISPQEFKDVDAIGADTTSLLETRAQQVYSESDFDELERGTYAIREIAFRPSQDRIGPEEATYGDITVRLSLLDSNSDNLSREFDANFEFEPVTVYEGELTLNSEDQLSPNGETKEFDQVTRFQKPFLYNPDDGDLIIEFRVHEGVDVPTNADFFGGGNPRDSFVQFAGDANADRASRSDGGFVTQFTLERVAEGDFDANGVLDVRDIDLLFVETAPDRINPVFDLNNDGKVNAADVKLWVHESKNTWIGDTNLDGEFNSEDLVTVFQAGKYELDMDAGWAEGDWNVDGRFDSGDLVAAFQDGGYEQGARPTMAAVPEPASFVTILFASMVLAFWRRHNRR